MRSAAGRPHIRHGCWGERNPLDGASVTAATRPISQAEADALFDHAMGLIEPKLDAMVHIPLADYEAGALPSMQYNIGSSAMAGPTVIRLLNLVHRAGAAEQCSIEIIPGRSSARTCTGAGWSRGPCFFT
jgi:GH24 family phage-related lysozyme (muramidase)